MNESLPVSLAMPLPWERMALPNVSLVPAEAAASATAWSASIAYVANGESESASPPSV